ncbi:MAG: hypothetical protein CL457_03575 [Acidimicrobiaceae bacterium]|nr:hypothetical protein [Acidimicrobiaceae bacterium]|tara:strand:+ start:4681 stop:4908 length:228 start_codon:yes stop_codon:yes gene_type:complete
MDKEESVNDHDFDEAHRVETKKPKGSGAVVLGAAMIALGDILEPEKTTVEIVQENDDPESDLPFDLNFGDLPPLS